jgi:hypothetical protein
VTGHFEPASNATAIRGIWLDKAQF